jgi:hypothetical protein
MLHAWIVPSQDEPTTTIPRLNEILNVYINLGSWAHNGNEITTIHTQKQITMRHNAFVLGSTIIHEYPYQSAGSCLISFSIE